MKINQTAALILGGNLLAMLFIYLPYAFKVNVNLEIIVPGLLNILLIGVNMVALIVAAIVPSFRSAVNWWAIALGALMLLSFPACLATLQISEMMHAAPAMQTGGEH